MNISNIKNNMYNYLSYKDFVKNDNGDLVLKGSKVLRSAKAPDLSSYSSYGIR